MSVKIVRKALLLIPTLLLVYLGIVGIWAWASVDEAVSGFSIRADGTGLSKKQTAMLLKIEDPTFFDHVGLSLTDGQGLTTISSSVARDVFLFLRDLDGINGVFQTFYRGVFECCKKIDIGRDVMALVLNASLSKEKQLSLFVSKVYMGSNNGVQIKGLEQASNVYFGKPLNQVADGEFAGLVGMILAPNRFLSAGFIL